MDPSRKPRRFNILILGPDTRIGQSIIKKIDDHFHFLNIAVPTGQYKGQIVLPASQMHLNLSNPDLLSSSFRLAEVIIACASHYATDEVIIEAARTAPTKFINACFSYPEAVIEAACHRLPFRPTRMEATQSASGCALTDLWVISHLFTILPTPRHVTKEVVRRTGKTERRDVDHMYLIDQGTVSLDEIGVAHSFAFTKWFYAWLFWIFSLFLRFIYPGVSKKKPCASTSTWTFAGRGLEHSQEYEFVAVAEAVDAELLRPDLALAKALDALAINKSECHDWGCCSKLKVRLRSYTAVKEGSGTSPEPAT
jgi:hypothetical protein